MHIQGDSTTLVALFALLSSWPVSTLVIFLVAVQWYRLYRLRNKDLSSIPTVGHSAPILSYVTASRFSAEGHKLLQEGYDKYKPGLFKIAMWDHWCVTATGPQLIEDIGEAPEDVLSMRQAMTHFFQTGYTMGPNIMRNPYHIPLVRAQLTRRIAGVIDDIHEEVVATLDSAIQAKKGLEWTKLSPQSNGTMAKIICRISNRVFVGAPTCLDDDYLKLNSEFAFDVAQRAGKIKRFPRFLHPIVGPLLTRLPSQIQRQMKHIEPIIEHRRRLLREHGDKWNKPDDMLMWLMDTAEAEELSTVNLARRVLAVNFASIHTSSTTFTYALYDIAANPQYLQPLREEVEAVVAADGWTKAAMSKMRKVDSFLHESQRVHGVNVASLRRLVLKPFTFSNGITVPPGTILTCNTRAVHHDAAHYDHPDVFDPSRLDDLSKKEWAKHQMVSTSTEHLAFGLGVHACPGRFFVATEMKLMLAHIVVTYDVKFDEGQDFPPDRFVGESSVPGVAAVMFRRRQTVD
ncbi:cytochrome P450 [Artomyces pyxidatus]|uniref:Cytochrome P450 n=1 Tax=Artomyces pyxidatus TaxID=48021 RepID=A0ACB8SUV8_9AGAM|nr:cytochrome P450 [Artomyces pyxidatus]